MSEIKYIHNGYSNVLLISPSILPKKQLQIEFLSTFIYKGWCLLNREYGHNVQNKWSQ